MKKNLIESYRHLSFNTIWPTLIEKGWWKIDIGNRTDTVYMAMNFYMAIYVNVIAAEIWDLENFHKGNIIAGVHYFERCVSTCIFVSTCAYVRECK